MKDDDDKPLNYEVWGLAVELTDGSNSWPKMIIGIETSHDADEDEVRIEWLREMLEREMRFHGE